MEAAVLGMIQDLESMHAIHTDSCTRWMIEKKFKIPKEMLDFMRNLKMEERSRLKYLMADLVELAQDVIDVSYDISILIIELEKLEKEIKMTKMRMTKFGADEKNIGVEKEEEVEEEVVVGLEEKVEKFVKKAILKNSYDSQIMCIKGMIGIGKTTLARQVYKACASQFERHAWVSISSDTSKKEILMTLIQQMVEGYERDPSLEEMVNRSLQRMLHKHLQDISYFIVLDNMPNEMGLKSILRGLPSLGLSETRCLLLLTSRYKIRTIDVHYYTYEMKVLDSDKSWKLFLKTVDKITSVENRFSKNLEKKGREMLKKCWGLPIAIKHVARQKAKQRLLGMAWEELFDSIDLSESLKLLEPMYFELEEEFKPHFSLLSFFKENAIMREEKLEQIWAANGLDFEKGIKDLAHRSIIEVFGQGYHMRKRKCHLNPLLHIISIRKAEEEMGLEILRSNGNSRPSQSARHRIIHCGREKFNYFTNQDSEQLLSLIFHGGGGYLDNASSSYWESFERVKILDMEDFGVKTLSDSIGTLIELSYLGLRNNYLQEIPHSLGGLKKLEALDIAHNFMVEVPDIIWEMDSLCHLHMSNVIFQKPLKVAALRKLDTLAYISMYDLHMSNVICLQKLGIEEVDENSALGTLLAVLAMDMFLTVFYVRGFRFRSMPCLDGICSIAHLQELKLDGNIGKLPSADYMPPSIRYITLVNTCLAEDPMPILEKLRYLTQLKLQNAYTGREMVIQRNGFRNLEVFCIKDLWNLRKIQVDDKAMRHVEEIEISNCPKLETLPVEIQKMSKLQKFKMVTTKRIATKIRNSGLTSEIFEVDIYP
ncbi:probable disease resistance protein At1g58602 [Salvia hispanica]|uniref:probable disease resistance protein At1g58602 n=1 Tax=Salvia hispanica TaxID=49212 RepID=UPI0020096A7E|nr:probable disease resistance protein At1g58602 [Salvia hispanica]XP_047953052.1 probable disease resistance protein At1g58602 [Salvia hispanica]